jgi:hypothetical protein
MLHTRTKHGQGGGDDSRGRNCCTSDGALMHRVSRREVYRVESVAWLQFDSEASPAFITAGNAVNIQQGRSKSGRAWKAPKKNRSWLRWCAWFTMLGSRAGRRLQALFNY